MDKKSSGFFSGLLLALLLVAGNAGAVDTRVTVRVLAQDAKFIGSGMGGAMVEIRDLDSGKVLASGLTSGGTGDTALIMKTDHARGQSIAAGAAAFSATLDLSSPTRVQISARGPMSVPESANRVSLTQWLLPGKHMDAGDGIVLHMPGFALQTLAPATDRPLPQGQPVKLVVKMVMMCGCPITPDGLWDANAIEITAHLNRDGEVLGEYPLQFTGETSQFGADLPADKAGEYEVSVTAYDGATGNTGLHKIRYSVAGN